MCRCCEIQAISFVGVHSYVVELTSLAIQLFQLLSILIKPNVVLAWLDFNMYLAMGEPAVVPLFLVGIMPISGVAVVLRD